MIRMDWPFGPVVGLLVSLLILLLPVVQHEELRACLKEYADINIWQVEKSAAGEDTIAFYESARPYTTD